MNIALPVLGGLGLFLYGMTVMSAGIQKAAGDELKRIIEVLTTNIYMGILVGTIVAMVIQSSGATTVMVVGFVNAGIMSLYQAAGVIMGANIGTTITGQLIAFNLTEYAPLAVIIGVAFLLFSSRKRVQDLAEVIIGVGVLFIGMDMMGDGLQLLAQKESFVQFMTTLDNPFYGMLAGLILTTLVQSSSASVGLLQALGMEGLININLAFPILFGENIGKTTTAMFSSIGANKNAKKAAIINLIFSIVGTVIFMTILNNPIRNLVVRISPDNVSRQIANAHSLFNIIGVLIQLPFIHSIIKFSDWLIPDDEFDEDSSTIYLDDRLIETPSIALGQINKEIIRMADLVLENLKVSKVALISGEASLTKEILEREKLINELDIEITNYLMNLSNSPLSDIQHNSVNRYLYIVNDLERIGDHVDNLEEITQYILKNDVSFSKEADVALNEMFDRCILIIDKTKETLTTNDKEIAQEVRLIENTVDELEEKNRTIHIDRLNKNLVDSEEGIVFLDALSNLERLSDHASNIATYILNA